VKELELVFVRGQQYRAQPRRG